MIDLPASAPTTLMNVKCARIDRGSRRGREADLIFRRLVMIGHLKLGIIDAVKFPKHAKEIGLAAKQVSHNDSCTLAKRGPAKMFSGKHALGLEELFVKFRERQLRGQNDVLNVKEAVIARGEPARFGGARY